LVAFLNAVLDRKDRDRRVTLEIVDNKELTRELINDKTAILDVRAKTEDGTQIDIEVQLTNQHNMDKRRNKRRNNSNCKKFISYGNRCRNGIKSYGINYRER